MLASSRGTLCRANARGRDKSRPYGQILCFEPTGMAPPIRAAVGRDALIPPHPAPPRTPAGGYGIRPYTTNGGRAANRETANSALHQTPVGDDARIVPGTPRRRERLREG